MPRAPVSLAESTQRTRYARSSAQADKKRYQHEIKRLVEEQDNLTCGRKLVEGLVVESRIGGQASPDQGVRVRGNADLSSSSGHLDDRHIFAGGDAHGRGQDAGRPSRRRQRAVDQRLAAATGHSNWIDSRPALLPGCNGRTIDFAATEVQPGDDDPAALLVPHQPITSRTDCHAGSDTKQQVHELIRRTCTVLRCTAGRSNRAVPGIALRSKTKSCEFPSKPQHQMFLEPEGHETHESTM